MSKQRSAIWLSHTLDTKTPLYGGGSGINFIQEKSIENGDSCNTKLLQIPSHAGTHVDAPLHFVENGMAVEDYTPDEWFFSNPALIFLEPGKGELIKPDDINISRDDKTDMILFCTPFEKFREKKIYWDENPGIAPEVADYLLEKCPDLKIIGMNFISISSFRHRDAGRMAHKAFLEKDIRIIEDMHLLALKPGDIIEKVIVAPLRFQSGDGAPCSVIGRKVVTEAENGD